MFVLVENKINKKSGEVIQSTVRNVDQKTFNQIQEAWDNVSASGGCWFGIELIWKGQTVYIE